MPVIEVEHLTKEYRLGALQSLKQTMLNAGARLVGRPVPERPLFKALDDVSFSIEQGEVVGIIGHNGAGKSTLLKMLARISTPTSGSVKVKGRIAPLIEVGAGFVPDFTGRENVYLNGAILGMSKREIDRKFDEIVDFAEMAEFIDTPVKRYSSGMQIRLAFSVATSIDSEVLIVDEVLAVGDLSFQRKCFARIEQLIKQQNRAVLLVSHNMRQVARLCPRALLLEHGHISADGTSLDITERYFRESNRNIASQISKTSATGRNIRASGEVDLTTLEMLTNEGMPQSEVKMGDSVTIRATFKCQKEIASPEIIFGIHTADFIYLASMGTAHIKNRPNMQKGTNAIDCKIDSITLVPGVYCLRVGVIDKLRRDVFYAEMLNPFTVFCDTEHTSQLPALGFIHLPATWTFTPTDQILNESDTPPTYAASKEFSPQENMQ